MTPITRILRDPFGPADFHEHQLNRLSEGIDQFQKDLTEAETAKERAVCSALMSKDMVRKAVFQFANGAAVAEVRTAAEATLSAVERAFDLRGGIEGLREFMPFHFSTVPTVLSTYALFAFAACLSPSQATLRQFFALLTPIGEEREELFDRLARVFDPERPLAARYPKMECLPDWTKPVRAALAQPAAARAAALGACMKNWPATMRPFGLKTKPKEWHDLFPYFAFEIALAVCAYDIDDSGFRDHPFYPRELVDHYRAHIRATRDAARPIGLDPDMPMVVTVRTPRADLARSKRKGIARWVELVTAGDTDAVDAVIGQVGKPRKVGDVWALMEALVEAGGYAVQADIKDGDTVAAQAEALAAALQLGAFVASEEPPAGTARVEQVLRDLRDWLAERSHQLVWLRNDDDAAHAVAVGQAHLPAFVELSAALGLRTDTTSTDPA